MVLEDFINSCVKNSVWFITIIFRDHIIYEGQIHSIFYGKTVPEHRLILEKTYRKKIFDNRIYNEAIVKIA